MVLSIFPSIARIPNIDYDASEKKACISDNVGAELVHPFQPRTQHNISGYERT
jgi:hypothetical protein